VGGESLLGIGLLGCAVVVLVVFIVFVVAAVMIKNWVSRAATRTLGDVGTGIAGQAAGVVFRVGEKELVKGFDQFKKTVSHQMLTSDPQKMETAVTKVAQRHRGLITPANVIAALDVDERLATDTLRRLAQKEVCNLQEEETELYAFPGFMEKRQVKVCDYCGSIFEPDEAQSACLSCGAQLKQATTV